MNRLLRNLRIHTAVVTALACLVTLILVVAGLSIMADRSAQSNLATLNQIGNEQLNELNRADSLLNQAMLAMETASNLLMVGRTQQSNEQVEVAANRIERAETRFNNFAAAPRDPQGQVLGEAVEDNFHTVLALVKQQHESFAFMDINTFNQLRGELAQPLEALAASITAFVQYGFERVATTRADAEAQGDTFTLINALAVGLALTLGTLLSVASTLWLMRRLLPATPSEATTTAQGKTS